jgi:hypothetical protein
MNYPPTNCPRADKRERLADEYVVVRGPVFADGGQDTFCGATTPIRRWRDEYTGLTTTQAQVLDDWFAANLGTHLSFTLTDSDGNTFGGVKVTRYERGHSKRRINSQFRRIEFEDRS